jgi:hypothetical protein
MKNKEKDPVAEIRAIREGHAKKFQYDLDAIFGDIKRREKKSGRKTVSFAKKRLVRAG